MAEEKKKQDKWLGLIHRDFMSGFSDGIFFVILVYLILVLIFGRGVMMQWF
ncbi:MAG: hypothetical protein AAF206_21765 [Bacteroidota bacterium]